MVGQSPAKRWNSYQHIPQTEGEFQGLAPSTDVTLDQTHFFREAEDVLEFKTPLVRRDHMPAQPNGQSTISHHQASYEESNCSPRSVNTHTPNGSASNMHYGYVAVSKDILKDNFKTPMPMGSQHYLDRHSPGVYSHPYGTVSHSSLHSSSPVNQGHEHSLFSASSAVSLLGDTLANDITSWQQKHQENLHRQQIDVEQVRWMI